MRRLPWLQLSTAWLWAQIAALAALTCWVTLSWWRRPTERCWDPSSPQRGWSSSRANTCRACGWEETQRMVHLITLSGKRRNCWSTSWECLSASVVCRRACQSGCSKLCRWSCRTGREIRSQTQTTKAFTWPAFLPSSHRWGCCRHT